MCIREATKASFNFLIFSSNIFTVYCLKNIQIKVFLEKTLAPRIAFSPLYTRVLADMPKILRNRKRLHEKYHKLT